MVVGVTVVTRGPLTLPVQGGDVAELFHLAILSKRYGHGIVGQSRLV